MSLEVKFKKSHKFSYNDLFMVSQIEVADLFWRELKRKKPNLDNIQVFLDSGLVDVNAPMDDDKWEWTPLHYVADKDYVALSKLLVSADADIDAEDIWGRSPLHVAISNQSIGVARVLVSCGADINSSDNDEWTPLHDATRWNYTEMAEFLIENGADVNAKDDQGRVPLHYTSNLNSLEIAEFLINSGANVNVKDSDGCTPLHWMAALNRLELISMLIEHPSIKVGIKDNSGETFFNKLKPKHLKKVIPFLSIRSLTKAFKKSLE